MNAQRRSLLGFIEVRHQVGEISNASIRHQEERAVPVNIAHLDQPGLFRPPIRSRGPRIEARRSVVNLQFSPRVVSSKFLQKGDISTLRLTAYTVPSSSATNPDIAVSRHFENQAAAANAHYLECMPRS